MGAAPYLLDTNMPERLQDRLAFHSLILGSEGEERRLRPVRRHTDRINATADLVSCHEVWLERVALQDGHVPIT